MKRIFDHGPLANSQGRTMALSGHAHLQSAAIQLAASFERLFPTRGNAPVQWEFFAWGRWCAYANSGSFGSPMDRWGAFLRCGERGGERYALFELLLSQIVGLRDVANSLVRCKRALCTAIRASAPISREIWLYHDLFREVRRKRWNEYGIVLWDQGEFWKHYGDEVICRMDVLAPNVALIREMAQVVAVETHAKDDRSKGQQKGGKPCNPQLPIWKAKAKQLKDAGYTYAEIAEHLKGEFGIDRSRETIEDWLKESRRRV